MDCELEEIDLEKHSNGKNKRKNTSIDLNANKKQKLATDCGIAALDAEKLASDFNTNIKSNGSIFNNDDNKQLPTKIVIDDEQKSKNTTKTAAAAAAASTEATARVEIYNAANETPFCDEIQASTSTVAHQSPKKRLQVPIKQTAKQKCISDNNHQIQQQKVNQEEQQQQQQKKNKFIYGNYSHYYGYRNQNKVKEFHDIRLDIFETHTDFFNEKELLDIGCNMGLITMAFAKNFPIKNIIGLDIDKSLIKHAHKNLLKEKKLLPKNNEKQERGEYPYNISFICSNYVLRDDVLLEIERERFDVILCLSITKWIHLNFGDAGLKQAFKRMYLQLRSGGKLILEAQPFDNYKRRKKLTDTIFSNYKAIKLFPKDFTSYLLSEEVGFQKAELLAVPEHCINGFKRPIQIFYKQ